MSQKLGGVIIEYSSIGLSSNVTCSLFTASIDIVSSTKEKGSQSVCWLGSLLNAPRLPKSM